MNRVGELDRGPGLCSFQNLIVWAHFYDFALFWQMNCRGGWLVGDWVNGLLEGVVLEKLPCGGKVTT